MAWTQWVSTRGRKSTGRKIAIYDKRFSWSAEAVAMCGTPDYVQVFFDPVQRRIGFRQCTKESPHAVALKQERQTRYINAAAMIRHWQITERGRFNYTIEDGMLIIDLSPVQSE